MRAAIVENGITTNVIEIDADQVNDYKATLPAGVILVTKAAAATASPGDEYDGTKFTKPPE